MSNQSKPRSQARPPTERSEVATAPANGVVGSAAADGVPSEPCNTLGGNSIHLRCGIDSLYLTVRGQLRDEAALRLEVAREAARSPDDAGLSLARFAVADRAFNVGPTGGKIFRYLLDDHAYRIQLKGKSAKHLPLASVQIRSWQLLTVGVRAAVEELEKVLSEIGMLERPFKVSRLDLCADFVTPSGLDDWSHDAWVTRARHIDPHIVDQKFTGWSIGRGEMSARLYNKTAEIIEHQKLYMRELWTDCGWDGVSPVSRLEFQFRSQALEELGARVYPQVLDWLGGLWRYASDSWLRLTLPNLNDETRCRWPTHPLWTFLQSVRWDDDSRLVRAPIKPIGTPSDVRMYGAYMAVLTSYMAATGLTDTTEAWGRLDCEARSYIESLAELRNAGFDIQARQRAARKALEYGLDYDGAADLAREKQDAAVARAYRRAKQRGVT